MTLEKIKEDWLENGNDMVDLEVTKDNWNCCTFIYYRVCNNSSNDSRWIYHSNGEETPLNHFDIALNDEDYRRKY